MKFNDQETMDITGAFRDAAKAVGDYLYAEWGNLAPADSGSLGQMYVTLKNALSYLSAQAAGIIIDDDEVSLAGLSGVVKEAAGAFMSIADAAEAKAITTALIDLAAAIPTGKAAAIAAAIQNLQKAASL